jgi:hypothetical protein
VSWLALPALWIALGGWREPLVLADVTADMALRERTIAYLTVRLDGPHVVPTNRLLYWIAYANFRQNAAVSAQMATAPTREVLLQLTLAASRYHFRATLLTHRFGLDDRSEWLDESRALGAPWEFISPYLAAPQPAASSAAVWRERMWLARIDPASAGEIETRFVRERPNDDFNAAWVETFDEAMALPEAKGTTLAGDEIDLRRGGVAGWTALFVWMPACETCGPDLERFDALAREYPGHVLLLASGADVEQIRLELADRGLTIPAVVVPTSLVSELSAVPGSRLLVSPDLVFVRLRGERWELDLRHAFAVSTR